MLKESHKQKLLENYGIDPQNPSITDMIDRGLLRSVTREEAAALLGLDLNDPGLESGGVYLEYPGTDGAAFTIRLDVPYRKDGKERKYMRPAGQGNRLFVPPWTDLEKTQELWLTEGEFKALAVSLRGQPCVAVAGVFNWRTNVVEAEPLAAALELEGEKTPDRLAIIPDFQEEWVGGKAFVLWYDSDIRPDHQAYPAFQRLAEQLYRLGAVSVKILTVPPVKGSGKTGLDDYFLEREKAGKNALAELNALADETEEYLPVGDGARAYAAAVAGDRNPPVAKCVRAVAAVLVAEGEAAAEEVAEEIDRRRARALLKDAKRLVKALKEKEKRADEARARKRAKKELERLLSEARQADELERLREAVQAIRTQEKKKAAEVQREVFELTAAVLTSLGKFYVDDQDHTYWFSTKEKILYRMDSREWNRLLTSATGLTDSEVLGNAVRKLLDAHAAQTGEKVVINQISYFDRESLNLYLHLYNGRVLRLSGQQIEEIDNGTDGVLFLARREWVPWDFVPEILTDAAKRAEAARWFERFCLNGNFDPTSPLSPPDAKTVLLTWLLAGFFRSLLPTRPILLLRGETESGKSMLARLILRLVYGGLADVGKQHEREENAMTYLTNYPWTVFDNVDEHVDWLPDLLAIVGTGGELPKRKLYTTNELERFKFDTWLILTARTPRFKRDDVATRLLPLRLAPLTKKEPESRLLAEVADPENRNLALSYLVILLNQIVAVFRQYGLPDTDEDIRLADYAAFLRAFLRGSAGDRREADAATNRIITAIQQLQAEFLAENDPLLDILTEAIEDGAVEEGKPIKTNELFAALAGYCRAKDYEVPVRHPVWLARRLVEMQAAVKVRGLQVLITTDGKTKTSTFTFERIST
ncbi:MAG: DNA primase catalytic core domain protein [Thermoanaerobacterales bacterium 50_218]|nr:MAG: DNA primase catalytic core domain protein [Thermoanaerobacterales bacterium 50_218]